MNKFLTARFESLQEVRDYLNEFVFSNPEDVIVKYALTPITKRTSANSFGDMSYYYEYCLLLEYKKNNDYCQRYLCGFDDVGSLLMYFKRHLRRRSLMCARACGFLEDAYLNILDLDGGPEIDSLFRVNKWHLRAIRGCGKKNEKLGLYYLRVIKRAIKMHRNYYVRTSNANA